MNSLKIFYAVLNMGLGHAARSLPLIRELLKQGNKVWVGSNGRSLYFLQQELPNLTFFETPDYGIEYSKSSFLLPRLFLQLPQILNQIKNENRFCKSIAKEISPDMIISDHCYGMYHPEIPCFMLSHQINFAVPGNIEILSKLFSWFNYSYHQYFKTIIIPDFPNEAGGMLSGRLSEIPNSNTKYQYAGILSSLNKETIDEDLNLLVSISGPEPQRTLLEKIVLRQIENIPGNKVVVLGKSESSELLVEKEGLRVYSHVERNEFEKLINRAQLVLSRPGYSTIMELAEIGKKALLVPTPGQTEQGYLARRMKDKEWYYFVAQNKLDLNRDLEIGKNYKGLNKNDATKNTVKHILRDVLRI
jgi:uncharacterized protein (TIGR00661 family)